MGYSRQRVVWVGVGEALELGLIHRGKDVPVDGRQSRSLPRELLVEILRIEWMSLQREREIERKRERGEAAKEW